MSIFLSAVGVLVFLLVIWSAFNYGRQVEADFRQRAEAFAKSAVGAYSDYLGSTYYTSETQRRWMSSCPAPSVPEFPPPHPMRTRRADTYRPSDDPEFVQSFEQNQQATVWLQGGGRTT